MRGGRKGRFDCSFMTASVHVFYLSIYIYLFTCLISICNLHIGSQFIYLFTFNDPSQESSFLKEVGFLGRRRSIPLNYSLFCSSQHVH